MNKLEMVKTLKEEAKITKQEAEAVVEIFFNSMTEALAQEERVEIRGLWSFYIKHYKEYCGRNPKTGEIVKVGAKKLPFFKPGKELKVRVRS